MTIWPEHSVSMSFPTQIHSYLATLVAVSTLVYPETNRTLWEERCRVEIYVESPEFSIPALIREDSSHVDHVIRDLMEKCADELWTKFHGEFSVSLPGPETVGISGQ